MSMYSDTIIHMFYAYSRTLPRPAFFETVSDGRQVRAYIGRRRILFRTFFTRQSEKVNFLLNAPFFEQKS